MGALSFMAACTSTVPEAEFSDVSDLAAERMGETATWEPAGDIPPATDEPAAEFTCGSLS